MPTFDAYAVADTLSAGTANTVSANITVANQSNRVLYCDLMTDNASISSPAFTFAGQAMTQVATYTVNGQNTYRFRLIAPPTGSGALAGSWTGAIGYVCIVRSYYDVHQTTPERGSIVTTGNASSTNPSVSVTSAVGDLVEGALNFNNNDSVTDGGGQTRVAFDLQGANGITAGVITTKAGSAGSVASSWTVSPADRWSALAMSLQPPAATGPAADAVDVATASAALSTQIKLGAAAADVTSVTAAVTAAIRLAAAAIDTATASGAFATGAVLQAAALDVALATAALSTAILANGQAVDVATANGTLTNWASVTLSSTLYTGQGGILDPNFWLDSVPTVGTTVYYDSAHITIYPNGEISSDVANCAAVVQFNDGSSWALGLVVFTDQLAAVDKDVVSASGALSTAIKLAAAAQALVTATAAFSTGAGLGATATDTAAASGTLTTKIPLSALAADVATAVGALTAQIKLAATATDAASATGALNSIIGLQAAANSVAASSAALSTLISPAANAQAQASGTASLTTAIKANASAVDIASAAASLNAAIMLVAQAADSAGASASLTTSRPLIAAAIDVVTSIAVLSTGISLSANAASIAQATADLSAGIALFADAASQATATAVLTDIIESPPVDAYHLDARYVVSKSIVDEELGRRTPRFITKDPLDRCVLGFDFSDQLDAGETLTGRITLSVAAIAGSDSSATAILVGVPSYNAAHSMIMQPIFGGLDGCKYYIKVAAATTNPNKVVSLAGLLPVAS